MNPDIISACILPYLIGSRTYKNVLSLLPLSLQEESAQRDCLFVTGELLPFHEALFFLHTGMDKLMLAQEKFLLAASQGSMSSFFFFHPPKEEKELLKEAAINAIKNNRPEIIGLLLFEDLDRRTMIELSVRNGGENCLRYLLGSASHREINIACEEACSIGNYSMVKLALESKADILGENNKNYPLRIAAGKGHKDIIMLLLEKKADPSLLKYDAIIEAHANDHEDIVEILLQAGGEKAALWWKE